MAILKVRSGPDWHFLVFLATPELTTHTPTPKHFIYIKSNQRGPADPLVNSMDPPSKRGFGWVQSRHHHNHAALQWILASIKKCIRGQYHITCASGWVKIRVNQGRGEVSHVQESTHVQRGSSSNISIRAAGGSSAAGAAGGS